MRGDLDVNETKLRNYLEERNSPRGNHGGQRSRPPASSARWDCRRASRVVYDASLKELETWVATGANETGMHYIGFNIRA